MTRLERNCCIIVQDFTENESKFNVRGIMYTKEVHVKRPYKVAEPRISHIQRDNVDLQDQI